MLLYSGIKDSSTNYELNKSVFVSNFILPCLNMINVVLIPKELSGL